MLLAQCWKEMCSMKRSSRKDDTSHQYREAALKVSEKNSKIH